MTRFFASRANMGQPIDKDRPCAKCGYNLRGLSTSGRCPECGAPIFQRQRGGIDFCDLPPGTIRKFSYGFYLAAATLTGILLLVFWSFRLGWTPELYAGAVTVLSFVWFAAVWLMTSPLDVPYDQRLGAPWELTARSWARWLELGWFSNAVVAWVHVTMNPGPGAALNVLTAAYIISELAGVAGVAVLCLLLASFASWVRDDFAERCFNYAFGGLVLISPVLFFVMPFFIAIAQVLVVFFLLLWFVWVGALFAFPIGLWSLGRSLTWAVRHSKDRIQRATEVADSLAPEPAPHAPTAATDEPIPVDATSKSREIRYSMSLSRDEQKAAGPMRRDKYDHERGDARSAPENAPQPDIF